MSKGGRSAGELTRRPAKSFQRAGGPGRALHPWGPGTETTQWHWAVGRGGLDGARATAGPRHRLLLSVILGKLSPQAPRPLCKADRRLSCWGKHQRAGGAPLSAALHPLRLLLLDLAVTPVSKTGVPGCGPASVSPIASPSPRGLAPLCSRPAGLRPAVCLLAGGGLSGHSLVDGGAGLIRPAQRNGVQPRASTQSQAGPAGASGPAGGRGGARSYQRGGAVFLRRRARREH